jgi:hypothetical protein
LFFLLLFRLARFCQFLLACYQIVFAWYVSPVDANFHCELSLITLTYF